MKTLLSHKESKTKDGICVTIEIAINQSNHIYLSVCGEVREVTDGKLIFVSCGQCTDEMREFFPEYKDFLDLHLCDMDGAPMYAIENGIYFLKNFGNGEITSKTLKRHFRVGFDELSEMMDLVLIDPDECKRYIDSLRPRWKKEMDAAIERLERLCGKKMILE